MIGDMADGLLESWWGAIEQLSAPGYVHHAAKVAAADVHAYFHASHAAQDGRSQVAQPPRTSNSATSCRKRQVPAAGASDIYSKIGSQLIWPRSDRGAGAVRGALRAVAMIHRLMPGRARRVPFKAVLVGWPCGRRLSGTRLGS
jgi:hypothetical protein